MSLIEKHHSEFTPEEQTSLLNSFVTPPYQPRQETKVIAFLDGAIVKLGGSTYSGSERWSRTCFVSQLSYSMANHVYEREAHLPLDQQVVGAAWRRKQTYAFRAALKRKAKQWVTQLEKQGRLVYREVQITAP